MIEMSELIGKTFSSVKKVNSDTIQMVCSDDKYTLTYIPDCCADCSITDVAGDLNDLVNSPIVMSEMVYSGDTITGEEDKYSSFTWTFVKLATVKGYVTITWYGSSNGYYSETPSLIKNDDIYAV
jgi:hypothetical protein